MAIYFDGVETYKGAVLKEEEHMWMDGMLDVHAVVWDDESKSIKRIQVGYYGIDGSNLAGGRAEIDATDDTIHAVRKSFKEDAYRAFCRSVIEYKTGIRKGTHAEVVRGRKVKKGTMLEVFWVGEKETYKSRQYDWMHETEMIAGCYDENGNKVWIKAEYLKSIDQIKSPNAKERKKFIKAYIEKAARAVGA